MEIYHNSKVHYTNILDFHPIQVIKNKTNGKSLIHETESHYGNMIMGFHVKINSKIIHNFVYIKNIFFMNIVH